MNIFEKFENEKRTYRRFDDTHPLEWYIGYDEEEKKSLVLVTKGEYIKYESTNFISVNIQSREDNNLALSFTLINDDFSEIFLKFCEDIVESSRINNINKPLENVVIRWNMWRNVFKNSYKDILKENEIRGLIGELLFLKEYMIPNYGVEKSIVSWVGPTKAHKDYEINDTWYEVKTIVSNALTVKISSLQQLDSILDGELVIIYLENTNEVVDYRITLNSIVNDISDFLVELKLKSIFFNKLGEVGYFYSGEYDNYNYKLEKIERYEVTKNNGFPTIKQQELFDGIVKVSYEILLEKIRKHLIKE